MDGSLSEIRRTDCDQPLAEVADFVLSLCDATQVSGRRNEQRYVKKSVTEE